MKQKLSKIDEFKKANRKINEEIISLEKKAREKENEKKETNEKIEEIKNSDGYIESLKEKGKIERLKTETSEKVSELERLIDFKKLASFFHIFEKQMEIVKLHRENFREAFRKDSGKNILHLLNEAKMDSDLIRKKINEIENNEKEISEYKEGEIKKDFEILSERAKKIKSEAEEFNHEILSKKKAGEKLDAEMKSLEEKLRDELNRMNVPV